MPQMPGVIHQTEKEIVVDVREVIGLKAFWPELDEAVEQVVVMRRLANASPGLAAVKRMSYVLRR